MVITHLRRIADASSPQGPVLVLPYRDPLPGEFPALHEPRLLVLELAAAPPAVLQQVCGLIDDLLCGRRPTAPAHPGQPSVDELLRRWREATRSPRPWDPEPPRRPTRRLQPPCVALRRRSR